MEASPNQYTEPLPSTARDFWRKLDAQLVLEEVRIERQKAYLSEATAEAMTEWDIHITSLPLDEAMTALNALYEYKQEQLAQRDIVMGRGVHTIEE